MNAPRDTQPAAATPASAGMPPANHRIRLPDFELGSALTAEQRDFLDEHGFIRFRGAVSERARALGATLLRGPRNVTRVEDIGLLVEGYGPRPPILGVGRVRALPALSCLRAPARREQVI